MKVKHIELLSLKVFWPDECEQPWFFRIQPPSSLPQSPQTLWRTNSSVPPSHPQ